MAALWEVLGTSADTGMCCGTVLRDLCILEVLLGQVSVPSIHPSIPLLHVKDV